MKFALVTVMGLAAMLFFGALPASVPGQPNRRVAQLRRKQWLPVPWFLRKSAHRAARRNATAFTAYQGLIIHSKQWGDGIKRTSAAWTRGTGISAEGHIVSLFKKIHQVVVHPQTPVAAARKLRSEASRFDIVALNQEYAVLLTHLRRRVSPTAAPVQYDAVLFEGCRAFNQELERGDSLYHSPTQPKAELCGMSTELEAMRANPRRLAQYILTKFDQSPRHAVIQARPDLTHVAISVGNRFFVVRLNSVPTR